MLLISSQSACIVVLMHPHELNLTANKQGHFVDKSYRASSLILHRERIKSNAVSSKTFLSWKGTGDEAFVQELEAEHEQDGEEGEVGDAFDST